MDKGVCFAGPRDDLESFSPAWWDSLIAEEEPVMCLLTEGHSGAHEWTPTAQIRIVAAEEEPEEELCP